MMVETKVGREGPAVSPIKVWAPSWWARKRSTVETWGFMTPATVLVAVSFLIPTLLSYKRLVHEHTRMPLSILGWVAIVLVYYYTFAFPGLRNRSGTVPSRRLR